MSESLEDLKARRAKLQTPAATDTEKPRLSKVALEAIREQWGAECWTAFQKGKSEPPMPEELLEEIRHQERIQPENNPADDPKQFKIGDLRGYDRQAGPWFVWPNPGEPKTPEVEERARTHYAAWSKGSRYLENLIKCRGYEILLAEYGSDFISQPTMGGQPTFHRDKAEAQNWLAGFWASKRMTPPSEQTLEAWGQEYIEEHRLATKRKSEAPSPPTNTPSQSSSVSDQPKKWDGVVRNHPL